MPLPKPNKEENKKEFIDRCMENKIMEDEYPKINQRYAICLSQYERKTTKK